MFNVTSLVIVSLILAGGSAQAITKGAREARKTERTERIERDARDVSPSSKSLADAAKPVDAAIAKESSAAFAKRIEKVDKEQSSAALRVRETIAPFYGEIGNSKSIDEILAQLSEAGYFTKAKEAKFLEVLKTDYLSSEAKADGFAGFVQLMKDLGHALKDSPSKTAEAVDLAMEARIKFRVDAEVRSGKVKAEERADREEELRRCERI